MKKKVNVFGKGIPVFAIVILGLALVSAALVPYLSGLVTGTVTASSPMEQKIGLDGINWEADNILALGTMHGGGEKTLYVQTKNLADKPITGNVNNLITNSLGVTCDDFSSLNVRTSKNNGGTWDPVEGYYNLIASNLCSQVDANTIKLSYGPLPIIWVEGQTDLNEIVATFKVNTIGTYVFTSQVVPAS